MLLSIIRDKVTSKVYQTSAEQSANSGIILKVIILRGLLFFFTPPHISKIAVYRHTKDSMQILCVVSECLYKLSLPESLRQRLAKRESIKRKCGRENPCGRFIFGKFTM